MCPVCTVAVGAGLGISRLLGIDDALTSVWIGALILSVSFWTVNWLKEKKINVPIILSIIIWESATLIPLYAGRYIGRDLNTIWGIDKIIFGMAVGSVAFLFGAWLDLEVRRIRKKQFFNFQKVVFPIISLIIASVIVFLITK